MKKYVIIMIIGAALISITISASADQPVERTEEVNMEEPIIAPAVVSDDLIIAPNPDTVVVHNAEEGERTIGETVIATNPYDGELGEELIDSAHGAVVSENKTLVDGIGIQVFIIIGAVLFLLIGLLVIRRKSNL